MPVRSVKTHERLLFRHEPAAIISHRMHWNKRTRTAITPHLVLNRMREGDNGNGDALTITQLRGQPTLEVTTHRGVGGVDLSSAHDINMDNINFPAFPYALPTAKPKQL